MSRPLQLSPALGLPDLPCVWKLTALAMAALPLAACMNLSGLDGSSQYGCQAPAGVKCESVSGTYYNSLKNNLPSQRSHDLSLAPNKTPSRFTPVKLDSASSGASSAGQPDQGSASAEPMPLRSQGKVLGLWFKPWKDADGDLFDEGHVYVQVDNGDWLIDHVQQRIRDAYAPVRAPRKAQQASHTPNSGTTTKPSAATLRPGRSITDAAKALQAAGQGDLNDLGDQ